MPKYPTGRGNVADLPWRQLLAEIRSNGGSVTAACRVLDICDRTVWRHIKAHAHIAARVERARQDGHQRLLDKPFVHGLPGSYRHCRCEVCRFANTVRTRSYRKQPASCAICRVCGITVGVRGGSLYMHHSAPGVVCRGGEIASGGIRTAPASRDKRVTQPDDDWSLAERIEQEIAKGTPTRRIMDRLDVDYAAVKEARKGLDSAVAS